MTKRSREFAKKVFGIDFPPYEEMKRHVIAIHRDEDGEFVEIAEMKTIEKIRDEKHSKTLSMGNIRKGDTKPWMTN